MPRGGHQSRSDGPRGGETVDTADRIARTTNCPARAPISPPAMPASWRGHPLPNASENATPAPKRPPMTPPAFNLMPSSAGGGVPGGSTRRQLRPKLLLRSYVIRLLLPSRPPALGPESSPAPRDAPSARARSEPLYMGQATDASVFCARSPEILRLRPAPDPVKPVTGPGRGRRSRPAARRRPRRGRRVGRGGPGRPRTRSGGGTGSAGYGPRPGAGASRHMWP